MRGDYKLIAWCVFASILAAGSSCTAHSAFASAMYLEQASGGFRLPVQSIQARKFATVIHQQYDFSCGSAALATLLTFQYGEHLTEPDIFVGMWNKGNQAQIRKQGFSLLDMKRYLSARGLASDGYRVTLAQLRTAAVPGIALVNIKGYRHFVVVKGVLANSVLLGDPAMGLRVVSGETFAKMWNGIYFIIAAPLEHGGFNTAADWSLAPRSRYLEAMEPLSLQALSLVAPTFGQF